MMKIIAIENQLFIENIECKKYVLEAKFSIRSYKIKA